MSLKNRLFSKDLRRLSLDLTANLHHALKKLCKDKPIRLSQLKAEYDHYFKDRISTKPSELVTAALKSLEKDVVAVKVYKLVDNREMTDMLLGLRSASYAANMHDEDNPQLSKERLLNIIKDCDALGIQVRELEKRYVEIYGTQPSYLPYKSIKELLHRTPDVELASSGKNLRVRTRQVTIHSRKSQVTKIPSLNRNSMTSSLRARKTQDFMSLSICKITDPKPRPNLEMTNSILIPSRRSPDESPISSGSTSPNGSVDMTVSMVLPRHFHNGFENDRVFGKTSAKTEAILQSKEVMTTILNDFPAEGMSLKALTDEFLSILGPDFPLGMTTVEFLSKEFKDVIKLEADENGVRVFKTNSPLLPRRTIADVYTKLALQSNRKPSDRVLKVLKDIYKKRDPRNEENAPQPTPKVDSSIRKDMKSIDDKQKAVIEELQLKLSSTAGSKSRVPIKTQHRSKQNVIDDIKVRLKNGPIDYPTEFLELTKNFKDDNQSLLVDLMSSLNLCLKPQNGRMILQMS